MLLFNPSGIRGTINQTVKRSIFPRRFGARGHYIWAEGGNHPGVDKNNLIHQVNYFRTGDACGYRLFPTTWQSHNEGAGLAVTGKAIALNTAESAAFGAVPGTNWALRALPGNSTDTYLYMFNRGTTAWGRSIDGKLYYAALYSGALSAANVENNADVLLLNDDTPAGGKTTKNTRSWPLGTNIGMAFRMHP